MYRSTVILPLASIFISLLNTPAHSQASDPPRQRSPNGLNVFLDCQRMWCEMDHIRQEIPYVNWVRDRNDADLHVLATSQNTGGGRESVMSFIGLRRFSGRADTLSFSTSSTDMQDEERAGQIRTLQMGMVRFLAGTPTADHIRIEYNAPREEIVRAQPEDDSWNLWVFRIGANGSFQSESQQREYEFSGNIRATRTTDNWRMSLSGRGEYGEDRYEFDEDSVSVYSENTFRFAAFAIRNLGAHWGAGLKSSIENSIEYNHDLATRVAFGVEYSLFPYSESTRRSITFLYSLGVAAFDYEEITIDSMTSETRAHHSLEVAVGWIQPWGSANASLVGSSYMHDWELHRLDLHGYTRVRIVRGLDLNWWGSVSRIKDQIYLSGAGIPPDEILLHRRARGTDFELNLSFGLSYTFGSIFNNYVNRTMEEFR